MTTMNVTREPLLTKADRCEACAAAAMVRVRTENLGVWLFCGSHWDRSKDALPGVVHVHDERNPLGVRS
jgi:hypothetical protein